MVRQEEDQRMLWCRECAQINGGGLHRFDRSKAVASTVPQLSLCGPELGWEALIP